jgi:hypothetical protein
MSILSHYFLIGRKQPQAEKKSRCESLCVATREALDFLGAVATFACEEGTPA